MAKKNKKKSKTLAWSDNFAENNNSQDASTQGATKQVPLEASQEPHDTEPAVLERQTTDEGYVSSNEPPSPSPWKAAMAPFMSSVVEERDDNPRSIASSMLQSPKSLDRRLRGSLDSKSIVDLSEVGDIDLATDSCPTQEMPETILEEDEPADEIGPGDPTPEHSRPASPVLSISGSVAASATAQDEAQNDKEEELFGDHGDVPPAVPDPPTGDEGAAELRDLVEDVDDGNETLADKSDEADQLEEKTILSDDESESPDLEPSAANEESIPSIEDGSIDDSNEQMMEGETKDIDEESAVPESTTDDFSPNEAEDSRDEPDINIDVEEETTATGGDADVLADTQAEEETNLEVAGTEAGEDELGEHQPGDVVINAVVEVVEEADSESERNKEEQTTELCLEDDLTDHVTIEDNQDESVRDLEEAATLEADPEDVAADENIVEVGSTDDASIPEGPASDAVKDDSSDQPGDTDLTEEVTEEKVTDVNLVESEQSSPGDVTPGAFPEDDAAGAQAGASGDGSGETEVVADHTTLLGEEEIVEEAEGDIEVVEVTEDSLTEVCDSEPFPDVAAEVDAEDPLSDAEVEAAPEPGGVQAEGDLELEPQVEAESEAADSEQQPEIPVESDTEPPAGAEDNEACKSESEEEPENHKANLVAAAAVAAHEMKRHKDTKREGHWERDGASPTSSTFKDSKLVMERGKDEYKPFTPALARQIAKAKVERDKRHSTPEYQEKLRRRHDRREAKEAAGAEERRKGHEASRKEAEVRAAYEAGLQKKKEELRREAEVHRRKESERRRKDEEGKHLPRMSSYKGSPPRGHSSRRSSNSSENARPALLKRIATGESDTGGPLLKINMTKAGGYDPQDVRRNAPVSPPRSMKSPVLHRATTDNDSASGTDADGHRRHRHRRRSHLRHGTTEEAIETTSRAGAAGSRVTSEKLVRRVTSNGTSYEESPGKKLWRKVTEAINSK